MQVMMKLRERNGGDFRLPVGKKYAIIARVTAEKSIH